MTPDRLLVLLPTVDQAHPAECRCDTDPILVACNPCRREARLRADTRRAARRRIREGSGGGRSE